MFGDPQQTPRNKEAPGTPSMTPTRSVRRRASQANRPRESASMTASAVKRSNTATCLAKSQPEDFYHLRTRHVPLVSRSMTELWRQYGIYQPEDPSDAGHSRSNAEQNQVSCERGRHRMRRCTSLLEMLLIMVLSAFIGAFCYAHFQHLFIETSSGSSDLQTVKDVEVVRPIDQLADTQQLEDSLSGLANEIENLKEHFNRIKENVGSQVVSISQKGILEELLIADLACAGNMGSVLATPDTTTVTVPITVTLLWLFTLHFSVNHRSPKTTLGGLIQEVGDCWPFQGSYGRLVLKLHRRSLVSGVSISHIPPAVSVSGDVSSAPRHFQVLVHQTEDDLENGKIFGDFEYKTSRDWRQTFPLDLSKTKEELVDVIEFRFLKNHGNPNYTCVYRVHVHGKVP